MEKKRFTIEIEDYYGNTIGSLLIEDEEIVKIEGEISIADVDNDYIYDTETLYRVQMDLKHMTLVKGYEKE